MPTPAILKQYCSLGLSLLFGTLVVMALFQALAQWKSIWTITHTQAMVTTQPTHAPPLPALLEAVPKAHLFGQVIGQAPAQLPIAQLNWQVVGLVKVSHEEGVAISKVYLSIDGGPSHIYQKGDRLQGDIVIHEITPQAIIIERQGHLEQLPLLRASPKPPSG